MALSSAEAKFRGLAKRFCELLWLGKLLKEIGFSSGLAMNLYFNNKPAIDLSHNLVQHDRTKHVEIDWHFIKKKLEAQMIQFSLVKSEDQLTNILTKVVASKAFHDSLGKLGISEIYAPT